MFLVSLSGFAQQGSDEQLAVEFLKNGEVDKAIDLLDDCYSKRPSVYLYNIYFNALLDKKDFKNAEKLAERQQKKFKNDKNPVVDVLYVYIVSEQKNKAEKYFKKFLTDLPVSTDEIRDFADVFLNKNLTDYALQTLEEGRKIFNNDKIFIEEMANLYKKKGDFATMTSELLKMILQNPASLETVKQKIAEVITENPNSSPEIKKILLKTIQQKSSNMEMQNLWLDFLLQSQDFQQAFIYAKAYDKRFGDGGSAVLNMAVSIAASDSVILQQSNFALAEQCFNYVVEKGQNSPYYLEARSKLLQLYYKKITQSPIVDADALENLDNKYQNLISEIGINANSVETLRNWSKILAFYKNDYQKADSLLNLALKIPRLNNVVAAQVKLDLADVYLLSGEVWEASLLYSQVEKDFKYDETGFEAKYRNARLSYFIGEFDWALAQLDVLRASTSKLIANDAMEISLIIRDNEDEDSTQQNLKTFAKADLLFYQKKYQEAKKCLDEIPNYASLPLFDDILMKKAEISIAEKKYDEALSYLTNIYEKQPESLYADDALFIAANILWNIKNDKNEAKILFTRIILDYQSSIYVDYARERISAK